MKIAFIVQDLFGQGAEYCTAMLVRGFIAKGYDVDLLVSKIHNDYHESGRVPFSVPSNTNWIFLRSRHARENVLELRKYLKTTDAVAIVSMNVSYDKALIVAGLGLKKKPRFFTVQHGISFALDKNLQYMPSNDSLMVKLWHHFYYSFFFGVMGVSKRVSDEMTRIYHIPEKKVHTVFNPVYDGEYLQRMMKAPSHPWLIDKKLPTFIVAGSFTDDKSHMTALLAVNELKNQNCPVRLIVYGQGPLRSMYAQYIEHNSLNDYVSLPGFTHSLPSEIKHSDGYISSSQVESFGIAIAEGLVCGVPVISTDAPCGPREILDDGAYGQLVHAWDVKGLADAMKNVAKGLIKPAPKEAYERFEVMQIVGLYEKAMGLKEI